MVHPLMESAFYPLAFFVAALLYSTVGHGGASAYLAVMALSGFAYEMMRPCALWMNVVVSLVAAGMFLRAGHFRWGLFWPFAVSALPMAGIGGSLKLSMPAFHFLVAAALLVAGLRFFLPVAQREPRRLDWPMGLVTGAMLGLLSGLVGVGGGIFLTPLLLFVGWANPKEAAAVSAPFILVNSLAGLAGMTLAGHSIPLPMDFPIWLGAALLGGLLGSAWGSRIARPAWLCPALGLVLLVAAAKFALTALP